MITPHGGKLINCTVAPSEREALKTRAADLPVIGLNGREMSDVTLIASGAMSPLEGFMTRPTYESVLDTMAGISFLKGTGHTEIVLVGHSFGGAVVISAAPFSPLIKAVVALSSQTGGATNAADVSPRPLLLVHGEDDTRLPSRCSEMIYDWANDPKELVIYPGAEHGLR